MTRWDKEREASMQRLQTRDEHLAKAAASKETVLRDISKELERKGVISK